MNGVRAGTGRGAGLPAAQNGPVPAGPFPEAYGRARYEGRRCMWEYLEEAGVVLRDLPH